MTPPERLADTGAAVSIATWLISHALQWMPVWQVLAMIAAALSGFFAAVLYVLKIVDRFKGRSIK